MIPGTTIEFQKRQVEETKKYYFPLFDQLMKICPTEYVDNISVARDEIRKLIAEYSIMIKMKENVKCPHCTRGYLKWVSEEDYVLCATCNGIGIKQ